jgi:TolB-like protein/Flp pilus assembly protein TadD
MRLYEKFASDLSDDLDLEPSAATKTAVHSIRTGHATLDERLSLAALPWVNWSGREEDLYFTDGIHAEILTRLSMVGGLRVIARQSVVRFRDSPKSIQEIAGELGVRYLLEAGLLRATDSVRINVQLIDARLDGHIWADSFDFPLSMKNLLSAQTEIAQRVADQLKTVLRSEETTRIQAPGTTDLAAYDLYLLGRHRFRERSVQNLQAAIGYFEAAINKDANFALAWAGLADAWSVLPWYDRIPTREAYASGLDAARKALDLNPELAEVHTALGGLALYHEWDWKASEEYLLRALELNPNYAEAYHFLAMAQFLLGHGERAMDSMQMATTLNPLGNNFLHTLAASLYDAGRSEEAVAAFLKADQLEPPVPYGLMNASSFLFKEGRAEEAFRTIRKWGRVMGYPNPEGLPLILEARDDPSLTSEALALLEDVRSVLGLRAGDLVGVYLHLHDLPEAVRMVKESIAERHVVVPFLGMEPSRSEVLAMPEARAALVEVGVPYL